MFNWLTCCGQADQEKVEKAKTVDLTPFKMEPYEDDPMESFQGLSG